MWQTIGQPEAVARLEHSIKAGNLAHAYLFVGAPSIGKMTLALDLSRAVNCQGNNLACGECLSCRRIINGKHADIKIISMDSPRDSGEVKPRAEISIDDIRDLQRSASLPPYEGTCKVFIIDGAEYLSSEAANCLLKVIEEPPPRVLILLLATEEMRILPTVISRCQRIELKPMASEATERTLIEMHGVDEKKAKLLARLSNGCLGWATRVAADDSYLAQRDKMLAEMFALLDASWDERFSYAARAATDRRAAEEMIRLWLGGWRDAMLTKCGHQHDVTNLDFILAFEKCARVLSLAEIREFISNLYESLQQIAANANLRLVLETLMLDMPKKEVVLKDTPLPSITAV